MFRYEDDTTDINLYKPSHQPTPKAILQYSIDGKFIKSWNSISEAVKEYPQARGNISAVCKGTKKTAGGFIWRYKKE